VAAEVVSEAVDRTGVEEEEGAIVEEVLTMTTTVESRGTIPAAEVEMAEEAGAEALTRTAVLVEAEAEGTVAEGMLGRGGEKRSVSFSSFKPFFPSVI
jgi:hypothetical protein